VSTGRYSIQHLQKQTQIFQFLNQSYATREWRTQNLGLQKNLKNLQRYFFSISENSKKMTQKTGIKSSRQKGEFSARSFPQTKLYTFFQTVNQLSIHKIQKKNILFSKSATLVQSVLRL